MKPKVSILVPIYGVEKFIERCSLSLFKQSYDNIEYIFVNDCTLDKSISKLEELLLEFPNRKKNVRIINNQINLGIAGTRNIAIENSTGEYILFVDSDDYIEIDMVEVLVKSALENNSDIVICDYFLEWENDLKEVNVNFRNNLDLLNATLQGSIATAFWNKLIKKALFWENKIKLIEGINLGEDYMTVPKLIYCSKKISKVDRALYHYIQTNNSSYTKKISQKSISDIKMVYENLVHFFEVKSDNHIFLEKILEGKLRKKIGFIHQYNFGQYSDLINLFPETAALKNINFLTKNEKLSLYFIKKNNLLLLKMYLYFYKKLFLVIQQLKNR